MKIAVVTQYHNESRATLTRCIESVCQQSIDAIHFLIADGKPQTWIDEISGLRHFRLHRHHHDWGNTARMLGFLVAVSESFDAITFLDADHWLSEEHLGMCESIAQSDPSISLIIPRRVFHRDNGTVLPVRSDEIDDGYLDPNCHFVLPDAYQVIAKWGTSRKPAPRDENGTTFLFNLGTEQLRTETTEFPTVHTTCRHESVYSYIGEKPPPSLAETVSDNPIWLLGDGRSGTTWLFELINFHCRYRAYFEPFNPGPSKPGVELGLHRYLGPDEENVELEKHLTEIFAGRFNETRRPSSRSILYDRVLVKDIYANLFAYWAHKKFPSVMPVLLVRNPFAVAASKLNVKHWFPNSNLDLILKQDRLIEDHLKENLPLLNRVARKNDFVISQIAIWAVINFVPLRQFTEKYIHVVIYDDLVSDTATTLKQVFEYLRSSNGIRKVIPSQQIIDRPSSSTVHRAPEKETHILPSEKPEKWQTSLTSEQIKWGMKLISAFGLEPYTKKDQKSLGRF